MSPLFQRYTLVQLRSHISSNHLLIRSIFLSSISSFSQIDTGWESVSDRLHAHIEKQRLAETEIYILDPMTAQLTHETRLTSIALSTTSFPIIWCAGHLPAQNNNCHMFYQKLFLCINDRPVIVTGIPFHGIGSRLLLSNYA